MTQRLFKLKGNLSTPLSTGTVTVNGTEVFNGTFSQGSIDEPNGFLCEFAYTFDDSAGTDVQFPVVVTVATGRAHVGMFKYNYAPIVNPALTPEERAYITAGMWQNCRAPAEIQADVQSKGGWCIRGETQFAYGLNPTTIYNNRTAEVLNGVALSEEEGHLYLYMSAGSVLTFTTIVFSSVNSPAPV
jgi:hypothetical protein